MTDPKSWIEERRAIHKAATKGEWTASIADLGDPLDATIIDSDKCQGMWIASSDDDTHTAENAYAIADAHNMFPRALDAIERVLRVHWPDEFADAPGEYFCNECQRAQLNGEWPCATVQAIEGAVNHE